MRKENTPTMRANDAQTLVLSALADGPLHGYAINTVVEKMSGHRLGPGSLYGALARLEAKGLVEPVEGEGRRHPVRLTAKGRTALERTVRSMARVTDHVFETTVPDRIGYQDRLAATDTARTCKQIMRDALEVRPGDRVLDLGCGPGTDLASLAAEVAPTGSVIGLDSSEEMVGQARRRTADSPAVEVRLGDVHALPLGDADVDRARTDRLLQHAADPAGALREIRRVLRPGGRLVMAEPDWDSLAIDHPDVETSRAYTRYVADSAVRNGVIGRQAARLAQEAGFTVPTIVPVTSVFRDVRSADHVLGLHRTTERAVSADRIPARAARRWLAGLAEGPFFASVTLYVVVAEAPPHGRGGA